MVGYLVYSHKKNHHIKQRQLTHSLWAPWKKQSLSRNKMSSWTSLGKVLYHYGDKMKRDMEALVWEAAKWGIKDGISDGEEWEGIMIRDAFG